MGFRAMHVEDKINKYCNLSEPFKLYFESERLFPQQMQTSVALVRAYSLFHST